MFRRLLDLALSQWRVEIRRDFASPTACVFPSVCHPERRAKPAVEILRSKIAAGGISDGKIRLHFVSLRMTPSVSGGNINCLLWQSLFFLPFGTVLFTRGKSKQKHGAVLIGEITITKRSHRPVKRFVGTLLYRCKKRFNQAFSSGRRGTTKWWMRCYLLVLRSLWSKPRSFNISSATALNLFRILSLEYRKTVQAWI